MVLPPEKVFQPELLDEKLDDSEEKPERPVERPDEPGTRGEGEDCGCDDKGKEGTKDPIKKPGEYERKSPYTTKTDEDGYFELKIPDGAHVLVVTARGYYKYIHKFKIDKGEELTVRVPMEPWDEDGPTRPCDPDAQGERDGKLGEESSETDTKSSSSVPTGAEATGAMLNTILAGLLVIMLILSLFVFRKYRRKPINGKKKAKQ
jgi:hypothetical protein